MLAGAEQVAGVATKTAAEQTHTGKHHQQGCAGKHQRVRERQQQQGQQPAADRQRQAARRQQLGGGSAFAVLVLGARIGQQLGNGDRHQARQRMGKQQGDHCGTEAELGKPDQRGGLGQQQQHDADHAIAAHA